jgi:uncharacterized protein (DUF885 family)
VSRRSHVTAALCVALGCLSLPPAARCADHATPSAAASDPQGFTRLLREFTNRYYALNPTVAVSVGLHQYDGKLPDFSAAALRREEAWLVDMRQRTAAIDARRLDEKSRLYRDYLAVEIDTELFNIRSLKVFENNVWTAYLPLDPDPYVSRQYAPLSARMDAYTRHVAGMPRALEAMRGTVKPMPSGHATIFADYLTGLASYVTRTPELVFAEVRDSARQAAMRQANERAAAALRETARWVQSLPHDQHYALGQAGLAQMLWDFERIDTPINELRSVAKRDIERNLQSLRRACATYAPGVDLNTCWERVASHKPADGPVAAATRQVAQLRKLIVERKIVSIPAEAAVVVAESPPQWSKGSGTAYVSIPGLHEQGVPSIYYITPPNPAWTTDELRQYALSEAVLMSITIHCVWPGHVLETLLSHASGNPLAAFTYSYAFTEGWTSYVEEMMVHEALDDDSEMAIGEIKEALQSNVRILAAIGVHAEGLSVEAAQQLFVDKAFDGPDTAHDEAVRATFDPGYMFYSLGKLMIMKLRDDWLVSHPGASLRDFHDAFLAYGTTPVRLVRKAMLGDADDGSLFPLSSPENSQMDVTFLNNFASRYTAAWCSHNAASVASFFGEHGSLKINDAAPAVGRDAIARAAQGFMTAFPDLVVMMDSLSQSAEGVRYNWTLTGTNTGPGGTGRPVRISGFELWRFGPGGLVAESLGHFDAADYERQLDKGT